MKRKFLSVCMAAMLAAGTLMGTGIASAAEIPEDAVTATGVGAGIDGDVVVEVTADADTIYSVTVLEQNETEGIGSVAVEELPGEIVANNSILVDGVAAATVTSDAIKTAVRQALEEAGLDVSVFEVEPEEKEAAEKTPMELDCDVVVVGAGGAGLTAAAMATEKGASVIVVEKMPLVGGNSLKATGGMNAAGTKFQEALGITDSGVQEFIEDTMNGGHQLNNIDLVTTMSEGSSDAVNWLEGIGAPLPKVAATGGTVHKYLHEPEDGSAVGSFLVDKLSTYCDKLGIMVLLNTKAESILTEDGTVTGIMAADEKHDYTIKADSVVLATGGFGANFDLMTQYDPSLANAVTTNHAGATGDGILMAEEIGADTVDMDQIQLHPTVYQENGLLVSESVRSMGGILVNAEGKRFCNDMSTRDAVSAAELEQTGSYAYIIFDQRIVDDLASCQKYINSGLTVQADSYEELAQAMGLDEEASANFVESMNIWNEAVAAGEDAEFGRNNGMDGDLSTAPFYAIKIAPGIHHTMGGLRINTEAEVLDKDGNAIPGLYAAGETTGGVHGGNRIGGNAVCDFVVFGRIAGANV
ncbi:MAG: flavocytochrome c, partial [Blautia sp.]|nr:flavocytochrome c [Blautia sp.]